MKPTHQLHLNEDLLQYAWMQKHLLSRTLKTTGGEPLERLHPGQLNRGSGPDFFAAQIRIGNTLWGGNVEVHVRSSDWYRHGHQFDAAYNNVILHVVWDDDEPVCRQNGEPIPTLVVKTLLPDDLLFRFQMLMQDASDIPCQRLFQLPDSAVVNHWLTRLATERLELKVEKENQWLRELKGNWAEVWHIMLATALGGSTNSAPFEWLAKRVTNKLVEPYRSQPAILDALVFGAAGLIATYPDHSRHQELAETFAWLSKKHQLQPLQAEVWKFKGQRPAGFPPNRLQTWMMLLQKENLFSALLKANGLPALRQLLTPLGRNENSELTQRLIINAAIPFLFLYGKHQMEQWRCEKTLEWEEQLPAERNQYIQSFSALGLQPKNSLESQGLLQLKRYYCNEHQCLRCVFGNYLLQSSLP